jgi:MFS family permease
MQAAVDTKPARRAGVNQGLVLIVLGSLVTLAIVSLVPNLPQLLRRFSDVPGYEFYVPMIITVPSLCIALFSPVAGMLADRVGRRPILLVAVFFYAVVGVLPLLFDSLAGVIATRVGIGIMEATILTCGNALMGDYFSGVERDKWLGLQATLGTIIASALMLIGGRLGAISWKGPFVLYALGLPVFIWAVFALWEPARTRATDEPAGSATAVAKESGARRFPWNATVLTSIVTLAVAILYYVQAIQLGRMFAEHGVDSPARVSNFTSAASLGVLAGGFCFRYIGKLGIGISLAIVLACMGTGYLGVSMVGSAGAALPFALLAQFGNGMTLPALLSWTLGKYSFDQRGRGVGIWGSCFFAATFLSPMFVTLLGRTTGGFLPALQWLGIIGLLGGLLSLWLGRRTMPAARPTAGAALP